VTGGLRLDQAEAVGEMIMVDKPLTAETSRDGYFINPFSLKNSSAPRCSGIGMPSSRTDDI